MYVCRGNFPVSQNPSPRMTYLHFLWVAVASMSMGWNMQVDNLLREHVEMVHREISCSSQLFSIQSLDVKGLVEGG